MTAISILFIWHLFKSKLSQGVSEKARLPRTWQSKRKKIPPEKKTWAGAGSVITTTPTTVTEEGACLFCVCKLLKHTHFGLNLNKHRVPNNRWRILHCTDPWEPSYSNRNPKWAFCPYCCVCSPCGKCHLANNYSHKYPHQPLRFNWRVTTPAFSEACVLWRLQKRGWSDTASDCQLDREA